MLKMKLSRLKGKCHVQLSQDICDHMVKKFEKRSTVTCDKLPQINLKTFDQNVDKSKIKTKAHIKCFECSILEHSSSECLNKKSDQAKLSRRQRNLFQRRCFDCKEKHHNIAVCPKEKVLKQVC
jgi:ribosomal protein L4